LLLSRCETNRRFRRASARRQSNRIGARGLFALQKHRRPYPPAPGKAPVIDVPGGHGTNAGDQHKDVDQQEDEIEIVECIHALQASKMQATRDWRAGAACASVMTDRLRP
jgi:hypothetical protein